MVGIPCTWSDFHAFLAWNSHRLGQISIPLHGNPIALFLLDAAVFCQSFGTFDLLPPWHRCGLGSASTIENNSLTLTSFSFVFYYRMFMCLTFCCLFCEPCTTPSKLEVIGDSTFQFFLMSLWLTFCYHSCVPCTTPYPVRPGKQESNKMSTISPKSPPIHPNSH